MPVVSYWPEADMVFVFALFDFGFQGGEFN